jgi:hypothetical protein
MQFTLSVRICRSSTVNDQWRNAREDETAIYFTAPTLRNWDRTYDFSDLKSTDDFYICSYTKYKYWILYEFQTLVNGHAAKKANWLTLIKFVFNTIYSSTLWIFRSKYVNPINIMIEIQHKHRGPCNLGLLVQGRSGFSSVIDNATCQQHLVTICHMKFNGMPLKIREVRSALFAILRNARWQFPTAVSGQNTGRIFKGLDGICILTTVVRVCQTKQQLFIQNRCKQVVFLLETICFLKSRKWIYDYVQMNRTLHVNLQRMNKYPYNKPTFITQTNKYTTYQYSIYCNHSHMFRSICVIFRES